MRHGKKFNHLSRTADHRRAMLANMAISLIMHKRITTTLAKAKALKKYVEPLLTRAKDENNKTKEQSTTQHRVVFSYLQNKEALKELFNVVGPKIGDRPGGYTRIIKLGHRLGDGADIAFIELVDFDENMMKEPKAAKKTRRSRRSSAKTEAPKAEEAKAEEVVEEVKAEEAAPAAEETLAEEAKAE
ncbi:MAG: 50S ribosomal protein L17 [Prevotella sp.]|nr:50S ribosomal protein L17 [Prevotella sp.]